jgi:TetR/AcrR family transcriptional regulator
MMTEQHPLKGKCTAKERLVQAAIMLTEKRPFDEITIEEIIKSADLSRPAFYYHFTGGKEELRAELVHRGLLDQTPTLDTRLAILEAALRIFARSGVTAATLEDIATEAGVTRGALCWHFHSKDDLLSAIIQHYGPHSMLRPVIEQIELDLQEGVTLDDETVIRRLAGAFYDGFAMQSDYARLAFLLIYTHPQAANILAEKIVKGRKSIIEYIQKRQHDGYLRQNIDANLFVQILAMLFAVRAIGRGLNSLLPFANYSRDEVIDQLVSLLLYGMARRDQSHTDEPAVSS